MKIAVSGKGGVGKTFIAGTLASIGASRGRRVIAIDADSSPNLALTLGLTPEESDAIQPIAENRDLISLKTGTAYPGVYSLSFTVDDVINDHALATPAGVHLLVMGTVFSMGSGCTCQANALVRALLRHLVVKQDDDVILDLEAGVEHLGRGTADHVDILLVVSDANMKSLRTAKKIHDLAAGAGPKEVFLVGNQIQGEEQKERVAQFAQENGITLIGMVPFDETIRAAGMRGEVIPPDAEERAIVSLRGLYEKMIENQQAPRGGDAA